MQHRFLLRYIRDEMQRQKIDFKNNEAFFRLFMEEEPWEAYRSNMSNWLGGTKDGVIHKRAFIAAVNEKLGLSPEVWQSGELKQKEEVMRGVKRFKEAQERDALLFPWVEEEKMNEAQRAFIDFAKQRSVEEIEQARKSISESFVKRSSTQPFLIALLEVMYEKGAYDFVYEHIFPHLLDTYDNGIKAKKAHIYASLKAPMYREAFDILNSIKGDDACHTLALKTAAVSNIRRERFASETLTKASLKGLLETLMQSYGKLYLPEDPQGYYTGINLAYVVCLYNIIFSKESVPKGIPDEVQIYKEVQGAIANAKASAVPEERYYAAMSELEFGLLLGKRGIQQELEYMLESLNPSQHLIDQTRRQLGAFFVDIIEAFAEKLPDNIDAVKAFLEVLDAYTLSRGLR